MKMVSPSPLRGEGGGEGEYFCPLTSILSRAGERRSSDAILKLIEKTHPFGNLPSPLFACLCGRKKITKEG
jgi:hypothetical protein